MIHDPIADMLTRIRNAISQKHRFVDVGRSKINMAVLEVLRKEGFIGKLVTYDEKRMIRVFLRYDGNRQPLLRGLQRASSPGRRHYVKWPEVPIVQKGLGLSVVSTSKGIMSGREARRQKVGGELICRAW